jgi:hypothetical protein
LLHLPLGFEEYWAVFCAMVGVVVMVHAIRRFVGFEEYCTIFCVMIGVIVMVDAIRRLEWASVMTASSAWHAPSLVVVV